MTTYGPETIADLYAGARFVDAGSLPSRGGPVRSQHHVTPSELNEYLDVDPSGKLMVDGLANRYGWTGGAVWRIADDVVARLARPNDLAIELVWNGNTLVRAVRRTRAGTIEVKGNGFIGPAMLQIVAGWLEDTE